MSFLQFSFVRCSLAFVYYGLLVLQETENIVPSSEGI